MSWTIIQTFHKSPIHLDYLIQSNPQAQILLADISRSPFKKKINSWRNCDFLIREYIKKNISNIHNDKIAILEWDVLVKKQLPDTNTEGLSACRKIIYRVNKWPWFKEVSQLDKYQKYAIGIAPLCVLFMDKNTLNTWISDEFDDIYNKNIFCELRLPTILNSKNIKINSIEMPYIKWHKYTGKTDESEIYHSIKHKT